jgi:hypothetical protein
MGILLEGLIFKGLRPIKPSFQQSYPQESWTSLEPFKNQALTANSEKIIAA